jgi:hypothetical protein
LTDAELNGLVQSTNGKFCAVIIPQSDNVSICYISNGILGISQRASRLASAILAVILSLFNGTYAQSGSKGCSKTEITKGQEGISTSTGTDALQEKANTSDKEMEGLIGPVMHVYTESATITKKEGKVEESKRKLLEETIYDKAGKKIEAKYFPNPGGGVVVSGKYEYKYDDKGNIIEMTLYGKDNTILHKERYEYEFDSYGNWIKMTTTAAVVKEGRLQFEPTEVTFRRIVYYK